MSVYQRGPHWYYGFQIGGERYRGPCGVDCTSKTRAKAIEDGKRAEAKAGELNTHQAPKLCDFAPHFVQFVEGACKAGNLAEKTRDYYKRGVDLLKATPAWEMRLDRITKDVAATLQFGNRGPSSANNAIRTLSRLLALAQEKRIIRVVPKFKHREEVQRDAIISPELEAEILKHSRGPLRDAVIFGIDAAMRAAEICAMRWEDVLWAENRINIPKSKTRKGRRKVGMTARMRDVLAGRSQSSPWVFPSIANKSRKASKCGHLLPSSLDKMWAQMKARVIADGVPWPEGLVFHSCRHTGATRFNDAVGNEFKTADFVGHADTRTTRRYVHHDEDSGKIMDTHRLTLIKSA